MHLVTRSADVDSLAAVSSLCRCCDDVPLEMQREAWATLWSAANPFGIVVSDLTRKPGQADVAVAIAAYIHDWALESLSTTNEPLALRNLVRMVKLSQNPFVAPNQLAAANATDGLNLFFCFFGWNTSPEYEARLRGVLLNAIAERHSGNKLRSLSGEACGKEMCILAQRNGLSVINAYDAALVPVNEVPDEKPSLVGITREQALASENLWLSRMFNYHPPRLFFTEPQRQILLLAREGYTDNEIAAKIDANPDAVKKRWVAIYERVESVFPDLLPNSPASGRGSEKRRILIARLKERPEELRAFDRKAGG